MSTEGAIHFSREGGTIAICDGPELLVYGGDGSPRWKHFCDGVLFAAYADRDVVVALDADGRLTWFRSADGRILDQTQAIAPMAFRMGPSGQAVIVGGGQVIAALRNGHNAPIPAFAGATAAAIGPNDEAGGAGWPNGTFRAVDLTTGTPWGEVNLGAPVEDLVWSGAGFWVVAAGSAIHCVSGDGGTVLGTVPMQAPPRGLTVSDNGVLCAALIGHNQVGFAEVHSFRPAGHLVFRRPIGGVSFGPRGLLAIGLDDADATRLDVFTGASVRTEPHAGRGRNTWNYDSKLDNDVLRGAVAFASAGEDPIARYVGPPEEKRNWFLTCGLLLLACIVVCSGLTICGGGGWYFFLR